MALDAPHRPFVDRKCAERSVEARGRLVPVEPAPFEPRVSAFACDLGEALDQREPGATPAIFLLDEKIFEKQRRLSEPGRVAAIEEGETDRGRSVIRDQAFEWRRRALDLRAQSRG